MLIAHRMNRNIKDNSMPWSKSQKSSNQFKVDIRLKSLIIEPVSSGIRVVHEHSVISIEKLFEDQLEIFFFDTSFINSWLVLKNDPEWFLKLRCSNVLPNKSIQTISEDVFSPDF
mgnify:CR=1 FL=1